MLSVSEGERSDEEKQYHRPCEGCPRSRATGEQSNNISKMQDTALGTRIVEVHNGSSLFTGKAGQGPSNLRQYIIERDLPKFVEKSA